MHELIVQVSEAVKCLKHFENRLQLSKRYGYAKVCDDFEEI